MFWQLENGLAAGHGLSDGLGASPLKYAQLAENASKLQAVFPGGSKRLVMLVCDNSTPCLTAYLASLRGGHAVMLVNSTVDPSLVQEICRRYVPDTFIARKSASPLPEGYRVVESSIEGLDIALAPEGSHPPIHPDTAVLLSTSGSTGSPKFVRISFQSLQANAASIATYLGLTDTELPITTLPISYSYGLSVVNSHLHVGAGIACSNHSITTKEFWTQFREARSTSLAGVPFTYNMLERLRFGTMDLPSLRTMTQAGGRLAVDKIRIFSDIAKRRNFRFFVMYGQTEATARMTYVPPERLDEKAGSVGIPIPGGAMEILADGVTPVTSPSAEGELVYTGPNVMMGYAEGRSCLAKGYEHGQTLHTGDLGYKDSDDFIFITGRSKRFIKVFGNRVNLDEIEKMVELTFSRQVVCVGTDDNLHVLMETDSQSVLDEAGRLICSRYKFHHSAVRLHSTQSIPVTSSGKKDYPSILRDLTR